ncbi:MAG: hypothetical protein PHW95_04575 [Patescibacteria group bacterium]|nr:hypothetical protein [Patescibacteria group bacterium]
MFYALRVGLTLAVAIIVFRMFLPEIADRLIELIVRILDILNSEVAQNASGIIR